METKIKELAKKYSIPEELFIKVIEMEKEKIVLQNRKLVPEIRKLVEQYAVLNE